MDADTYTIFGLRRPDKIDTDCTRFSIYIYIYISIFDLRRLKPALFVFRNSRSHTQELNFA